MAADDRMARIRREAARHQAELEALRWLTPEALRARWHVSAKTVRSIPRDVLPYLELGSGTARKRRRYNPADVEAYEARSHRGAA
jgi:hypothetical protein